MNILPIVSLIAALGVATPTSAQAPDSSKAGGETPQSFVTKAAQDGTTEVELGKLAAGKTESPDVKKFGDRMVKDHGKANRELQALAKAKNLRLPTKLDAEHQSMVDMLKAKSGAEFDASYAEHMATAHAGAIKLFENASLLEDNEFAAFAKKTLPTLLEHKLMADKLNESMRSATAPSSGS